MSWNEKDARAYISEIRFLQSKINSLQKFSETNQEPSIEQVITILRNSQDKLYNSLATHGITPEDAYRIITESGDRQLVKDIIMLQTAKNDAEKQLADPALSLEKRQLLEQSHAEIAQAHKSAWNEVRNSPNRAELINKVEQAQTKDLPKDRTHDREHDPERTH
jgi:hypothetical protein